MPDGKSALLSARGGAGLQRLNVDGTTVTNAGPIAPIRSSMAIPSPDGKFIIANGTPLAAEPSAAAPAVAAVRGGAGPSRRGAGGRGMPQASVLDAASGAVLSKAPIGAGTEFIGFSQDAAYLVATITNGSHSTPTAPDFNDFGLLYVFKASGSMLRRSRKLIPVIGARVRFSARTTEPSSCNARSSGRSRSSASMAIRT